ncbi:hypothetical protein [Thalassomonas sp. RHCl1]|uniref:hypothetical protein n=1 Tax=Thalassomonas sp. RHCl1 TaxID=2995320 RepID=UPI00248D0380|nr:hypothetical protein [Thalassomonas sp. RHCl1]
MYSRNERHAAFAVISSFILDLADKAFPEACIIDEAGLLKKSSNNGAHFFFNAYNKLIDPTISWLADEGYIRVSKSADGWGITLTKFGAASVNLEFEKTGGYLCNFITEDNGKYFTANEDMYGPASKKVMLKGPAVDFIPQGWLG